MKTKYFHFINIVFSLLIIIVLCISCLNDDISENANEYSKLLQSSNSNSVTTHRWFYFTQDGFKETDIPRNAPTVNTSPWTHAIRITSAAFIEGNAYFAVNKLGLLEAPKTFGFQKNGIASETKLIKNEELFSKATVADIYTIENKPVINFFTNTIFEESASTTHSLETTNPFLVEFDTKKFGYLPLLSKQTLYENLTLEKKTDTLPDILTVDIREVQFIDNTWQVLFKSNQIGKTDFYALFFTTKNPITASQQQPIHANIKSIEEYQEITRPQKSFDLPKKIQNLLSSIPSRISYYVNYIEENSPSPIQYEHSSINTRPIQGYALGLEHCSIAIFEDGTICFAGGLPSKSVINNGSTKAFKLPDLGAGYVYGPMALAGSTLIVAWEETSFYETGASGFLAVDMEQVLYQDSL